MKNITKIKFVVTLITAPILIILGAYSFAVGNKQMAKILFIFGLINIAGGIAWIILAKKKNDLYK